MASNKLHYHCGPVENFASKATFKYANGYLWIFKYANIHVCILDLGMQI